MTLRKRRRDMWNWKVREISSRFFFSFEILMFCQPAQIKFSVSFQQKTVKIINVSTDQWTTNNISPPSFVQSSMNQFCNIMKKTLFKEMNDMVLLWHLCSFVMNGMTFYGNLDSLTRDANEWLIPGWLHQLHVSHPGEHVSLRPLRLHLPDHHHHHREVAGGLLPLLLPGGLHIYF